MIDWEFLAPVAMGWALHHWWTVMTALAAVGVQIGRAHV